MLVRGYMRGVLARVSSIRPSRFQRIFIQIRKLTQHGIYVRLLTLLFGIAVTSILIQAGSLFLLDYIPASRSVTTKIHQHELHWKNQLKLARADSNGDAKTVVQRLDDAYLNPPDSEMMWLIGRAHRNLSAKLENIGNVETNSSVRRRMRRLP